MGLHRFLVLFASLAPLAEAQGVHEFQVDPNSPFAFSGSFTPPVGPDVILTPVPDASFSPGGSLRLDLMGAGTSVTSGRLVQGGVLTLPDLQATVPGSVGGQVEIVGLELELVSVDAAGLPAAFAVDAGGAFSTFVVFEVLAGVVNVNLAGSSSIDLTGSVSSSQPAAGMILPLGEGLRFDAALDLGLDLAAGAGSASFTFSGALVADWVPFHTDVSTLSISAGGTQAMTLSTGGVCPGDLYLVVGSTSGTSPGTMLGSVLLPLNVDPISVLTASSANQPPFENTLGSLDGEGIANAAISAPLGFLSPELEGVNFDFAYVVIDPVTGSVGFASNAQSLTLLP